MKKLTKEEFVVRAVEIHGDKYNYDKVEYVNNSTKVRIWCNRCEDYFEQMPQAHMGGKGCAKCSSSMKLTTESFISKATLKHGDKYGYDKVEYVNNSTKVKILCNRCEEYFEQEPGIHLQGRGCFTCGLKNISIKLMIPYDEVKKFIELELKYILISDEYKGNASKLTIIDTEGYKYSSSFANLKQGKIPLKFHPTNPYSIDNFNIWIKAHNKEFTLLDEVYISNSKRMNFRCHKCNDVFTSTLGHITSGAECSVCRGLQVSESNCLENTFPEIAKEFNIDKNTGMSAKTISYGSKKKVWWKCSKDHEWFVAVCDRTSRNGAGCPICSNRIVHISNCLATKRPDLISEWHPTKNGILTPHRVVSGSAKKVWWKCKECEHEWFATLVSRSSSRNYGCPDCSKSKGEKRIKEFLILKNTTNIIQKEFEGLTGIGFGNLSYDFYLPQYNLLIEYQGEFHDRQVHEGHDFERQQEHDHRKREYAKHNNIDLLEIWYQDFDNVETILDEYFKTHEPQINTCTYSKFAI